MYKEVEGDLITLAKEGYFDVVGHGCNCFCTMGAGIAPQMAKAFNCDKFPLEEEEHNGDVNKLGQIDYLLAYDKKLNKYCAIVNAYTQFGFGANHKNGNSRPVDYEAISLCMRKINYIFAGKHIGLPRIGAGLAGGDWVTIRRIIKRELKQCNVTIVNYKP